MEATKLLLFLAFHVGAADSSGDEISNQETQLFFDRALHAAVVGYDLDPLKFPGFEFEVSVAAARVKLYNVTVYGLGTVCRDGRQLYLGRQQWYMPEDRCGNAKRYCQCSSECYCKPIFFYIDGNDGNKCVRQLHGSYTGHQREKCETRRGRAGNIRNRCCCYKVIQYRW
uniref:Putative secreted protein n=1 Tax=Ixodes ricinus TaxID=34613 RepID=A0A090XES8_IXORI